MRPPTEREQVVIISEESPLQRCRLVHDFLRYLVTEPGFLSIMHSVIGGQERGVDAGRYVVTPEKINELSTKNNSTDTYNNDNTVEHALVCLEDKVSWCCALCSGRPKFIDLETNRLVSVGSSFYASLSEVAI